jgi:hypothetical protein
MSYEYLIDPNTYSKNMYTKEEVFRYNRDYQDRGDQNIDNEIDDHLSDKEEFKYTKNVVFKKGKDIYIKGIGFKMLNLDARLALM